MPDGSLLRPKGRKPSGDATRRRFVYVAQAAEPVWEAADRFAEERGLSLSSVVSDALARYLADPPKPEER